MSLGGDDLRTFAIVQLLLYEETHRPTSFMYILLPYFIYHLLPIKHSREIAALCKRMRQLVLEQTVLKYVLTLKKKSIFLLCSAPVYKSSFLGSTIKNNWLKQHCC